MLMPHPDAGACARTGVRSIVGVSLRIPPRLFGARWRSAFCHFQRWYEHLPCAISHKKAYRMSASTLTTRRQVKIIKRQMKSSGRTRRLWILFASQHESAEVRVQFRTSACYETTCCHVHIFCKSVVHQAVPVWVARGCFEAQRREPSTPMAPTSSSVVCGRSAAPECQQWKTGLASAGIRRSFIESCKCGAAEDSGFVLLARRLWEAAVFAVRCAETEGRSRRRRS